MKTSLFFPSPFPATPHASYRRRRPWCWHSGKPAACWLHKGNTCLPTTPCTLPRNKRRRRRGEAAPPAHAPHINLERLNNKLLGRKAGERADYTPAEKAVLATLCQLEQRAIERTINDRGDDRQAFQAAKSAAGAYMQQFGQDLMEAA